MRAVGFEPTPGCSLVGRARTSGPKPDACTNSATPARGRVYGGLVAVDDATAGCHRSPHPAQRCGSGLAGATFVIRPFSEAIHATFGLREQVCAPQESGDQTG